MPVDRGDYRELGSTRNNSGVENPSEVKRDLIFFKGIMSDMAVRVDRLEKRGLLGQQQFKSMYVGSANIRNLYVPNSTSTPRVQITRNTHGGFAILGSGDTYSDVTGSGTYQVLFDYAKSPVGLYFANGAAYIGSAGITITGGSTLSISGSGAYTDALRVWITQSSSASNVTGINSHVYRTATATGSIIGLLGSVEKQDTGNATFINGANASSFSNATAGTITTARGISAAAGSLAAGGTSVVTTAVAVDASVSTLGSTITTGIGVRVSATAGTNQRGIQISAPSSGANNYAIYSDATAQSVHAGNVRIGSTVAPTVALDVTGVAAVSSNATVAGNLGVGSATAASTVLHIRQDASSEIRTQAAGVGANADYYAISHGGTVASPSATQNAQSTTYGFRGYDNAGTPVLTTAKAYIQLRATENWTTTAQGTAIDFATTAATTTTRAVRLTIDSNGLTIADAHNIVLSTTTGTKIGTATTQKLGFYNATPIVRPSAYTQTYSTAGKTHATDGSADFPAGGVGTAAGGWSTAANRDLAITRFNALRVTVDNIKQVVNGLIDDLQALGLIG